MNKKIAWVVPDFSAGSGGHRTIFQNIAALMSEGYLCDVYISHSASESLNTLKKRIEKNFGFSGNIYDSLDSEKKYDLVFATSWDTVRDAKLLNSSERAYFIQDYEPWFFPKSSSFELAQNTYHEDFHHITIGRWLAKKIQEESGVEEIFFFDFCADHNIYHEIKEVKKEKAICAIFQPEKPRRCIDTVLKALRLFKEKHPDYKIYLYGTSDYSVSDLDAENLGVISPSDCNLLYNKCLAGVCFSASNPSRIPFEMMTSGLPVVEYYAENTLYDFPGDGCLLTEMDENSILEALEKIISDSHLQKKLSLGGKNFMKSKDLSFGFDQFKNAVKNILSKKENTDFNAPKKLYLDAPISVKSSKKPVPCPEVPVRKISKDPRDHFAEEKIAALEAELKNIKQSRAYRFGLKIASVPQRIKKRIKNILVKKA